jgi:hypothetical protein
VDHRRAEPIAIFDAVSRIFQPLADQAGENVLFGKAFRADHYSVVRIAAPGRVLG